jgi:hypothetical protein
MNSTRISRHIIELKRPGIVKALSLDSTPLGRLDLVSTVPKDHDAAAQVSGELAERYGGLRLRFSPTDSRPQPTQNRL